MAKYTLSTHGITYIVYVHVYICTYMYIHVHGEQEVHLKLFGGAQLHSCWQLHKIIVPNTKKRYISIGLCTSIVGIVPRYGPH